MNKKKQLGTVLYQHHGYRIRRMESGVGIYKGKNLFQDGFKNTGEAKEFIVDYCENK